MSGGEHAGRPGPGGASPRAGVETDRDPGLQPERTRLAWRRTTLSCAVTALLAIRQALHTDGGPLRAAAVSLLALTFVAFLWLAHLRTQRLAAARPRRLAPWAALSVVGCTIGFAVFGAALLF
ncbi:Uncharacterized membrane protein YidH, DUF202 family [Streptomyces sp. DvalAA-14]|uniref:DUF202 domain-containing protein n=1 Tax=unclassified Streptomyces TaxID=2593676 RepID=UPI00081B5A8D|nr:MULTISPECIES: DUF202 domain-containing protein [unclassified Streptomyces]MYS21946.1 DUF202 domain-containing protein [Streptomyces sp. SID4948]SCE05020.1 Uncharacterized membrane protein YidH, DUF202 family [Streptomyces sp. DvalAA-14]